MRMRAFERHFDSMNSEKQNNCHLLIFCHACPVNASPVLQNACRGTRSEDSTWQSGVFEEIGGCVRQLGHMWTRMPCFAATALAGLGFTTGKSACACAGMHCHRVLKVAWQVANMQRAGVCEDACVLHPCGLDSTDCANGCLEMQHWPVSPQQQRSSWAQCLAYTTYVSQNHISNRSRFQMSLLPFQSTARMLHRCSQLGMQLI